MPRLRAGWLWRQIDSVGRDLAELPVWLFAVKNPHAVALGKLGGSAKSPAKTEAARKNAKKGGWPKGRKRTPKIGSTRGGASDA
jgi:hypothetical protein